MGRWTVRIFIAAVALIVLLTGLRCSGHIRPPRPMFHENYATSAFGIFPQWYPNNSYADKLGHWVFFDKADNVILIQATGTTEGWRSQYMYCTPESAEVRIGVANDKPDDRHVTIPRSRDKLVVILPDGRWESFAIDPGVATKLFRSYFETDERIQALPLPPKTLADAEQARLDKFLEGYKMSEIRQSKR